MASSDVLKALVHAHSTGDDLAFSEAVELLIDSEQRRGHTLVARDLRRIAESAPLDHPRMPGPIRASDVPLDDERGLPLAEVRHPNFGLERVVLSEDSYATLRLIIDDYNARDQLLSHGLELKRKALFFGPPGCGKTVTAEALAGELGLPLLYVRFDSLVSSYLGQTAANLRKLFEYVRKSRWVVLFDEFDAVGRSRDDPGEHGELKRVINSILQLMDGFRGNSLLIAATNHEYALDAALWRRFDEVVQFLPPNEFARLRMLRGFLAGFRYEENDLRTLAADTEGFTGSDLERVSIDAAKQSVFGRRESIELDDLMYGLKLQRQRIALANGTET